MSLFKRLQNREINGNFFINRYIPIRKTSVKCIYCNKCIYSLIIDLIKDMDIFKFRYHYFIPIFACNNCKDPLKVNEDFHKL